MTSSSSSFELFFEGWLVRQEHYLDELQSAQRDSHEARDDDLRDLVSRTLLHYQQYYEEKSRIAQRDVFLLFSPTWFSSLERALLWIAGFKPGLAFRLVSDSVPDLSQDQRLRITRLMEETRVEERALNDKLAKIHESVAAPPLIDLTRGNARVVDGSIAVAEEAAATTALKSALEGVVANANSLRTTLATKLVDILSATQAVTFLVAVAQFQLKIRTLGMERDAQRNKTMAVYEYGYVQRLLFAVEEQTFRNRKVTSLRLMTFGALNCKRAALDLYITPQQIICFCLKIYMTAVGWGQRVHTDTAVQP